MNHSISTHPFAILFHIGQKSACVALCMMLPLFLSCQKRTSLDTSELNQSVNFTDFTGQWKADGVGNLSVENYSLLMDLLQDGKCKMTVTYTTTQETVLTIPSVQVIDLQGTWKRAGVIAISKLKVTNSVTTYPPRTAGGGRTGNRVVHKFDDHEMLSEWKFKNDKIKLNNCALLRINHFAEVTDGDNMDSRENKLRDLNIIVPEFSRVIDRIDKN